MSDSNPEADALDVLIAQEQALLAGFQARRASADSASAAAVTGALALAALTATAAQTVKHIDKPLAWVVTLTLAAVVAAAFWARFLAGLRVDGHSLTSRSPAYKDAVASLHDYERGAVHDPVEARRLVLDVCRDSADDAQRMAESKERWGAGVSLALAVAVALTVALALTIIT
jgi:hypothetical protein